MSFTREMGFLVCECDECHEMLECKTKDFEAARECLREESWLTWRIANEHKNFCSPFCKGQFMDKAKKAQEQSYK